MRDLKRDRTGGGLLHLGKDGVIRSLSAEYRVVEAKGLRPEQIEQLIKAVPRSENLEDFQGIDGTRVPKEE